MDIRSRTTRAIAMLATALMLALGLASTTTPAEAKDTSWGRAAATEQAKDTSWGKAQARKGDCSWLGCGQIRHYSPDGGFNAAFVVACSYGDRTNQKYVYEGQGSSDKCPETGGDTDEVYVAAGNQIACMSTYGWRVQWDATGWHKIYDHQNWLCVHQRD